MSNSGGHHQQAQEVQQHVVRIIGTQMANYVGARVIIFGTLVSVCIFYLFNHYFYNLFIGPLII